MRYIGSKTLLLNNIADIVSEYNSTGVFCDPFGGIGTVGSFMKHRGYRVITGDILNFAHYYQIALISEDEIQEFSEIKQLVNCKNIEQLEVYLTNLKVETGWFISEYAIKRKYFTENNAKHIQACINVIWGWKQNNVISYIEYAVLVASLIQSFDKVANTAGTYYAYLKDYYRKARKDFKFEFLRPTLGTVGCRSRLTDANNLVQVENCDILYLDPPYNERNYGRYYHLPETIAVGIEPTPSGKSGIFVHENKYSDFNSKSKATIAFDNLVQNTKARCIIFHYTDDGVIDKNIIREIMKPLGGLDEFYYDSKGYNTRKEATKCQHHIYRVIK